MATVSFLLYITYHTIYFQYFTRDLRVEYITVVQMCFVAIYDSKKYVPGIKQSSRSSAADDTQFSLGFNFIYTSSSSILQVVVCSPTHDPVFCITATVDFYFDAIY